LDLATKVQIVSAVATAVSAIATVVLAYLTYNAVQATRDMATRNREMVEEARGTRESQERANGALLKENRGMVEANREMVAEMKADREARERPYVRVDVDYGHLPMLYVVVRNAGGGPAEDLRFDFVPGFVTPEYATPAGEGATHLDAELPLFAHGTDFLPAGEEIPVWWGAQELVVRYLYEQGIERRGVLVRVTYRSSEGGFYEDEFFLNPAAMELATRFLPRDPGEMVGPVVKAAEKINKAIDADGYVRIKTAGERRREMRRQWENMQREAAELRAELEQRRRERERDT